MDDFKLDVPTDSATVYVSRSGDRTITTEVSVRQTERDWFGSKRPRRIAVNTGLHHLALIVLATATGPRHPYGYHPMAEDYYDYQQRIRGQQVAQGIRIPPKKAMCTTRRRGRKFKG